MMYTFEEFWEQIIKNRQWIEKHPSSSAARWLKWLKNPKLARERYDATVKKIREEKKRGKK